MKRSLIVTREFLRPTAGFPFVSGPVAGYRGVSGGPLAGGPGVSGPVVTLIATAAVLILTTAAFVLLGPAPAARANSILPGIEAAQSRDLPVIKHYVEVDKGIWIAVKGERERRQVRFARLMELWSNDQREVALNNGWPTFRWRQDDTGQLTEIWSYPERDVEFVFDVTSGLLIEKRVR